jgi:hypothetical protein
MAFKTISQTDTLETFRTTFNALSQDDFGDIANLSGAISSTNLVDAMNETIAIATSTAGFTVSDDTSTTQIIGGGDTLQVLGTANQIQTVVTPTDTLTLSFPSDVTITNDLTVTNNLTASGSTHTLGTIEVSGNTLRSTDSSEIQINDGLQVINPLRAGVTTINPAGSNNIESTSGFTIFGSSIVLSTSKFIAFEGSTDDTFETILNVIDPTADRTINLPDEDGTILTTGSSGVVTSAMIINGTISTDDIADDQISEAKIADDAVGQDQLKSVVNLQILNSSGGVLKSLYGAGA